MKLADYYCDSFDLSFEFSKDELDSAAIFAELKIEDENALIDEDGDLVINIGLPSRVDPATIHAHLAILIRKDDPSGRVAIDFHEIGPKKPEDERPTFLEDVGPWLSRFFKKEIDSVRVGAWYAFEKNYETTIPLPFPLVVSNKRLAGLKVSGLSLLFPEEDRIEDAILQSGESGDKFVFLGTKSILALKTFDLKATLDSLNETVNMLVKENADADIEPQTKT